MFSNYTPLKKAFIFICALFGLNSYAQSTTYNSSTTFTMPAGVTKATVQAWGGGGKGGTRTTNGASGGGGSGAYTISTLTGLTSGSYTITVGAGSTTTAAGGTSIFKKTGGSDLVVATGGNSVGNNIATGAAAVTGGTAGGNGSGSTGGIGGNAPSGGNGGAGGNVGTILNIGTVNGMSGSVPGGGGGGGAQANVWFVFFYSNVNVTPGNGGDGRVIVSLWPTADYTNIVSNSTRVVDFTNSSTSNSTSYLWDFGDSNTSTAANPTHTYAANGTYNVKLTSTNASGSSEVTYSITVDNTLGIDDEVLSLFSIYPNPVSTGEIKMKLPNEIEKFDVTISSVLGQELYHEQKQNGFNVVHNIDATRYRSGIYFITVSTPNGKATKKLIIN